MPNSPIARASYYACPRGENVSPGSSKNKSPSHASKGLPSVSRSGGEVRTARDIMKGRCDLGTTTNTTPTVTSSASSPGSSTKQKWFASLRSRASQIPTPTSPTRIPISTGANGTMPASTISRLFRTPPQDKKEESLSTSNGNVSPSIMASLDHKARETSRVPLPKLALPSFDPLSDVGMKYDKETPRKETQAVAAIVAGEIRSSGPKVARYSVKCDVYYPSIPWKPSRTDHFENATAALSNYCLNVLLSEDRMYSNIILWTSCTPRAEPSKRQQRFTVLPYYLKPDRNALGVGDDKYEWAIIAFKDEPVQTTILDTSGGQHESLQGALARITAMGYHVDVWDKFDNLRWEMTMEDAQKKGHDWLCVDHGCREKYDAMLEYGIAGFSTVETGVVDEALERLRERRSESAGSESVYTEKDCQAAGPKA